MITMQTITKHAPAHPQSALKTLLARYVDGQIGSISWRQLMSVFDAATVTAQERLAMAAFFDDVIGEAGPCAIKVPHLQEAEDILTETRIN